MDLSLKPDNLALLSSLPEKAAMVVITGKRDAGKTTYCQKLVEAYRQAGQRVSGLLSPGRFKHHRKNGYYTVNLSDHETRLTASLIPGEVDGVRFGSWWFDTTVFHWGNRCLSQLEETDLLVLDELGYLELYLNTGWIAGFEVLRRKKYRLAVVVIRPECLEAFSSMGFTFQIKEEIDLPSSHA